jgi:hypothetical protein
MMKENGKWIIIAAGAVVVALILTFGDGIYDRQDKGKYWVLVNKFTGEAAYVCDLSGCHDIDAWRR